ncbi:MAG: hypothetical protein Aurels2KO_11220 [Aureliella sp.]
MLTETARSELRDAIKHEDEVFREAAISVVVGDANRLCDLLAQHPGLATAHSAADHGATLLHYVSSNAIEDLLQLHPASVYNRMRVADDAGRETMIAEVERIIRGLVSAGADPDALAGAYGGGSGATPINWLVSSGHPHVAGATRRLTEVFLDCGACPDGLAGDSSPIFTAVAFGVAEAVEPIVNAGARVDNVILAAIAGDVQVLKSFLVSSSEVDGSTLSRCQQSWLPVPTDWEVACQWALILGAMCGQAESVGLLLDAGVDIDAKPKISHMTGGPLHTACMAGELEVIEMLIAKGVDPTVRDDRYGGTPVDWAREGSNVSAAMKVGHYRVQYVRNSLKCPSVERFVEAVRKEDLSALRSVVDSGELTADHLNAPWMDFDAPALVAAKRNLEIVDCLVEAGADINQKSMWWAGGYGVLHESDSATSEPLIERGAKLDIWSAASLGKYHELVAIVEADPSTVAARGPDGQTALHCARTVEIAGYLVDQGAKLDSRCFDHNSTPLQYAVKERPAVAQLLADSGGQVDFLAACALGLVKEVESQLATTPDLIRICVSREYFPSDAADCIYSWTLGWYSTAHEVASSFGREKVVALLFEHSPPDVKLLGACLLGDQSRAKKLVQEHKFDAASLEQVAPHLAHSARNNNTQQVELLLESGFPVTAIGQHGATSLHWAAFHGNLPMAEAILRYNPSLKMRDADYACTPLEWARQGSIAGWHRETGQFAEVAHALIEAGCQVDPTWKPTGNPEFDSVFE